MITATKASTAPIVPKTIGMVMVPMLTEGLVDLVDPSAARLVIGPTPGTASILIDAIAHALTIDE